MKALVTGGAGFIGSHLVKKLVEEGADVTVVDDMSSGDLVNLFDKGLTVRPVIPSLIEKFSEKAVLKKGDVKVVTGDFVDSDFLKYFASSDYTHVFHLAANPRVEYSVKYPAVTTETNVMKTVELLSCCRSTKVKKFIFASSSAIYGNVERLPTKESVASNPQSPYGLQKYVCELFMKQFSDLYGIDCTALRLFNVYGPGCTGDNPYATAIAAWCDKLKSKSPLRSDGDGEQTRDMVYVEDVADAMIAASNSKSGGYECYNVASGESISNNAILDLLGSAVGKFECVSAPERPGDVKHTLASIDKIKRELAWEPKYSFGEGMKETIKWWEL